jgi:hypothetical protein
MKDLIVVVFPIISTVSLIVALLNYLRIRKQMPSKGYSSDLNTCMTVCFLFSIFTATTYTYQQEIWRKYVLYGYKSEEVNGNIGTDDFFKYWVYSSKDDNQYLKTEVIDWSLIFAIVIPIVLTLRWASEIGKLEDWEFKYEERPYARIESKKKRDEWYKKNPHRPKPN